MKLCCCISLAYKWVKENGNSPLEELLLWLAAFTWTGLDEAGLRKSMNPEATTDWRVNNRVSVQPQCCCGTHAIQHFLFFLLLHIRCQFLEISICSNQCGWICRSCLSHVPFWFASCSSCWPDGKQASNFPLSLYIDSCNLQQPVLSLYLHGVTNLNASSVTQEVLGRCTVTQWPLSATDA